MIGIGAIVLDGARVEEDAWVWAREEGPMVEAPMDFKPVPKEPGPDSSTPFNELLQNRTGF